MLLGHCPDRLLFLTFSHQAHERCLQIHEVTRKYKMASPAESFCDGEMDNFQDPQVHCTLLPRRLNLTDVFLFGFKDSEPHTLGKFQPARLLNGNAYVPATEHG
jgi:hypothetical protein